MVSVHGSNWVLVQAPASDEEMTREYCAITHAPLGGTPQIIDDGDIGYPFDGSAFLKTNLQSGTHTFSAVAQYEGEDDDIISSVQVMIP